jgi:hypothetical protein
MQKKIDIAIKYTEMFKLHTLYQHYLENGDPTNIDKIQQRIQELKAVLKYLEERFNDEK